MILDNTSKTIQVVLGEAKTTTNPEYTAAYEDINVAGGTFVPGASDGSLNGTSLVTVVAAPASSTQRRVKELSVYNADTVNHTVTVQYYDGTNTELLVYTTIAPGQTLWYGGGSWQVLFGSTGNAVIITGGTINGTTIGGTTPEPGTFTTLKTTSFALAGPWTPTDQSGASLSLSATYCNYIQLGNIVMAWGRVAYPSTADGSAAVIGGLPSSGVGYNPALAVCNTVAGLFGQISSGTNKLYLFKTDVGTSATNANLSTLVVDLLIIYSTT